MAKLPFCSVYSGVFGALVLVVLITYYFDANSMPQDHFPTALSGDEEILETRVFLENQQRIIKRLDDLQAMMNKLVAASEKGEEKEEDIDLEHFVETLTPTQKRKISNLTKSTIEKVKHRDSIRCRRGKSR